MKDTDSIFLVNTQGGLDRIPHQQYQNESLLHEIVDKHPELLVGDQINPENPPEWIVVRREAGIPCSEDEGNRLSVDHLFLDQYGRPTFVEVKRSSDSRIRREVVGQMLDYAANAQKYWPPDQIKELAIENFGGLEELNNKLREFIGSDESPEEERDPFDEYWNAVEQNLRSGQVRLLFVADEIPSELRRIIEYLNEHMPLVEVLGVEIRQYAGQDIQALVPRVVGQTESARQQKRNTRPSAKKTTREEFLDACPENTRSFFTRLISEAEQRGFFIAWGTKGFSIRAYLQDGSLATFFYGYPPGVNTSPVPFFQAYLRYIEDPNVRESLWKKLLAHIPFESKGYTLEIRLNEEGLQKAEAGLSQVLEVAERVINDEITESSI